MPDNGRWTSGLLAIVGVFAPAFAPWAWAGIAVTSDQLVTYDGRNYASQAVAEPPNGTDPQPLPTLQDLSTFASGVATTPRRSQVSALLNMGDGHLATASAGSPQLFVGTGGNIQFSGPVPTSAAQPFTQSQANQAPNITAVVDSPAGPLAFWSDGNPASPTDVLAAFQSSGLGSVANTVLAPAFRPRRSKLAAPCGDPPVE